MRSIFRFCPLAALGLASLLAACSGSGGGDEDTTAPITSASPAGGNFDQALSVTLSCSDGAGSGCMGTFYTLDGSAPTQGSRVYSTPISIDQTTSLKFFSVDEAGNEETVRTEEYVIGSGGDTTPPVTDASPSGGTYYSVQSVVLSCSDDDSGCEATYYTLDGSNPTEQSEVYAAPISIDQTTSLKFFSMDQAGNAESVKTQQYVIDLGVDDEPPLTNASPVGGSYVDEQDVSLTCTDAGSGCDSTYYTVDGSDPTAGSAVYSSPIHIAGDTTLKFFSVDVAGNAESIRTEDYQVVGQCTPGVDTDSDGLNDCDELDGWFMNLDLNGDGDTEDAGEHEVHVSSDPFQADADGDELSDLEENQRKLNPNRADTDQDGLSDWEEINIYFSDADHVDSDGDATGPNHDQLPDSGLFDGAEVNIHHTSPQMEDTDGDSFTDLEEIQVSKNPLVADLPRLRVGVITSVDVVLHADVNSGCEISNETMNASLTRDDNRSVVSSSSAFEYTSSMSDTIHAEMNASVTGIIPQYSGGVSNDLTVSNSTSLESSVAFENESARSVTDEYRRYRRQNCFSENNAYGGSITATIRVANVGGAAVYLQNMEVIAMKRDRANFGRLTTLASVELFDTLTSVGASPKDVAVDIPLSASQTMELLDDPSGLFIYASRYNMTDEDGRDYAFIESETLQRTGMLEIDYGHGRLERYLIATNVERDASNNPVGVNLAWALQNVLDMERGVDFDTLDSNGLSVLQYMDDPNTYGTDMAGYQGWLVMGDGDDFANDPAMNFEDIVLHPGETISLSFVHDSDLDGLFDKEEAFFGSDPLVTDTDGDMIGDKEEAMSLRRHPVVPEFPAGQRVAQVETVISTGDYTDLHTLVLLTNGTLWSLDGIPRQIDTPVRFESVSGGTVNSVTNYVTWAGISTDGDLYTWGSNFDGKLGVADQNLTEQPIPTRVGSACGCWAKVDVGARHVLAIRTDGSLWAWGYNGSGQLGTTASDFCPGSQDEYDCRRSPVQVDAGPWHDIAAGYAHSLGIKEDLTLWAWGDNGVGQLGTGDLNDRASPTRIYEDSYATYGDDTWRMVDAWGNMSLAALDIGANENPVTRTDSLRTWGEQIYTRYGIYSAGSDVVTYVPWAPTYQSCNSDANCGEGQSCQNITGALMCWSMRGILRQPYLLPVFTDAGIQFPDLPIVSISAGPFGSVTWGHVAAIGLPGHQSYVWQTDESYSWGYNQHGETGRGPGGENSCMFTNYAVTCNRDPKPVVDDDGNPFLTINGGRGIGDPTGTGWVTNPPIVRGVLNVWGFNANGELGLGPNVGDAVAEPAIMPEYPLP